MRQSSLLIWTVTGKNLSEIVVNPRLYAFMPSGAAGAIGRGGSTEHSAIKRLRCIRLFIIEFSVYSCTRSVSAETHGDENQALLTKNLSTDSRSLG